MISRASRASPGGLIVRYATRLPLSWPCAPLLNDAAPKVGIHVSFFCVRYSFHQRRLATLIQLAKS